MPARHLVVVPHTHWDREWYRTRESFRVRLVGLVDRLIELLEANPDFRQFTLDGQTIALRDYLAIRPEARERVARLVAGGRLLIGPWTVLPDEWLVSGEALIRNLRMGLEEAEGLGGAMQVGYVPDQFGHVGQLPQIFVGFGFEHAVLWRGVGSDVDETLFRWRSPDGSELVTAYLARGYGNGANLPRDPAALAARLQAEIDGLPGAKQGSVLLMNGSDHLEPQPDLPAALAAAAERLPGLSVEIGSLPGYLAHVQREARDRLPTHRGELRSGLRAPLLAGCASARIAQKRADFENDRLLTRYLEPLSAWLARLGGRADPGLLHAIWQIALENHPHDSICGCSIDAVHAEVDTRFRRVADLAGDHLSRIAQSFGSQVVASAGEGWPVVVWNPHAAGAAVAQGELELPLPGTLGESPALVARDAKGRSRPVSAEVVRASSVYAEYRLPARVVASLLRGFPPEFFGDAVCALARRRDGGDEWVEIWLGAAAPAGFDWESERESFARTLDADGDLEVGFRPRRMPCLRISLADHFPGVGLRSYRLAEAPLGDGSGRPARSGGDGSVRLANAFWQLDVSPAGRVRAVHGPTGLVLDDALRFVDEGDRGDTYSFDPVVGGERVSRLEAVEVVAQPDAPGGGSVEIRAELSVPVALEESRGARAAQHVALPVRLELRLHDALDRIEVRVEVDNRARDHRLRLHVQAPFDPLRFEVESAFEIVERPLGPPPDDEGGARPAELPSDACPQRRFATLVGRQVALSVANRGLPEVAGLRSEAGGASLALTLLRAVGWLSRGDLVRRPVHAGPPIETPGAQVPGPSVAELAIFAHAPGDPERFAAAVRFAEPPLLFAGGVEEPAPLADGACLLGIDDPEVAVSAIEPRPGGETWIRLLNTSAEPRRVRVSWRAGGPGLVRVDLRGRAGDPEAAARSELDLALRAFEIVALAAR